MKKVEVVSSALSPSAESKTVMSHETLPSTASKFAVKPIVTVPSSFAVPAIYECVPSGFVALSCAAPVTAISLLESTILTTRYLELASYCLAYT